MPDTDPGLDVTCPNCAWKLRYVTTDRTEGDEKLTHFYHCHTHGRWRLDPNGIFSSLPSGPGGVTGPMPTRRGDIVISHDDASRTMYCVWHIVADAQQIAGTSESTSTAMGRTAALKLAAMMAKSSSGAVYLLNTDTATWTWTPAKLPTSARKARHRPPSKIPCAQCHERLVRTVTTPVRIYYHCDSCFHFWDVSRPKVNR